jgi:hypothetical protein
VGPQGGAELGGGVRGSLESRVDGEGGAEVVAQWCFEVVAESGGRGRAAARSCSWRRE